MLLLLLLRLLLLDWLLCGIAAVTVIIFFTAVRLVVEFNPIFGRLFVVIVFGAQRDILQRMTLRLLLLLLLRRWLLRLRLGLLHLECGARALDLAFKAERVT